MRGPEEDAEAAIEQRGTMRPPCAPLRWDIESSRLCRSWRGLTPWVGVSDPFETDRGHQCSELGCPRSSSSSLWPFS